MTLKRREFLKKAAVGATGAAALSACGATEAPAAGAADGGGISGPEVHWRLVTSFPRSLDIIHGAGERIAERVSA